MYIFAMIQNCILQVSGQEVQMADLGKEQVLGSSQEVSRLFGSTGYLQCPKKVTYRMLLRLSYQYPAPLVSGNCCFWSFLTKTKQDQALPSHVHGKICPHSTQFWL